MKIKRLLHISNIIIKYVAASLYHFGLDSVLCWPLRCIIKEFYAWIWGFTNSYVQRRMVTLIASFGNFACADRSVVDATEPNPWQKMVRKLGCILPVVKKGSTLTYLVKSWIQVRYQKKKNELSIATWHIASWSREDQKNRHKIP